MSVKRSVALVSKKMTDAYGMSQWSAWISRPQNSGNPTCNCITCRNVMHPPGLYLHCL